MYDIQIVYDIICAFVSIKLLAFCSVEASTTKGLLCDKHLCGSRWHYSVYRRHQHAQKQTRIGLSIGCLTLPLFHRSCYCRPERIMFKGSLDSLPPFCC